jgi:hypothetical protein
MENEFNNREFEEKLKEENEFLKMKLMLEHGAQFGGEGKMPAMMEHAFLQSILAVENGKEPFALISIFEKLGKPQQFRSHDQYNDEEIETAWLELKSLFEKNNIELRTDSAGIDARTFYRIATEEFFKLQVYDFNVEGFVACYTRESK